VVLFGALHVLVLAGGVTPLAGPADTLAYALTGLCALVDLTATGLGLRRLRHRARTGPRPRARPTTNRVPPARRTCDGA
jgi:hypothetical protein